MRIICKKCKGECEVKMHFEYTDTNTFEYVAKCEECNRRYTFYVTIKPEVMIEV